VDPQRGGDRSATGRGLLPMRRRIVVLAVAQVVLPLLLLGLRWTDPGLDQLRFGWQMHTSCWGAVEPCR
jgi:hypothetical protein